MRKAYAKTLMIVLFLVAASVATLVRVAAADPASEQRPGASCTVHVTKEGTVVHFSSRQTFEGQPLILSGSIETSATARSAPTPARKSAAPSSSVVPSMTTEQVIGITLGRATLVRITTTVGPGGVQMAMTYGPPIRGVANATFVLDRGRLTGTVDGRTIVPLPVPPALLSAGRSLPLASRSLQMRDHRPPPQVTVDTPLADAIRALIGAAQEGIRSCQPIAGPHAAARRLTPQLFTPMGASAIELGPPWGLAEGGSISLACEDCENNCDQTDAECWAAAGSTCIFDFGISCAIGAAGCPTLNAICLGNCNAQGGACCKVACPECCDDDAVCCGGGCCYASTAATHTAGVCSNSVCCEPNSPVGCGYNDPRTGESFPYCCGAGQSCCGKLACCPAGQFCIDAASSLCCPTADMIDCGGTCCSSSACINNGTVCCDGGLICGNECCRNGEICSNGHCGFGQPCGDTFCGIANPVCCNGVCCTDNQCIGGSCCPQQRACGSTCCPPGNFCNNGTCVAGCGNGMDICTSPTGSGMCCPLYQCDNPSNDNVCVTNCCPGGCCPPGQVCCNTDGFPGHWGCRNQVDCFVAQ